MSNKKYNHSLVWFRNDLRLDDNPALHFACESSSQVSAVFFIAEKQWRQHSISERRKKFTFAALQNLHESLQAKGIGLHILSTDWFKETGSEIAKLCEKTSIDAVFCNYEYALDEVNRDKSVAAICEKNAIAFHRSNASVIIPPGKVTTGQSEPYKVFTPFKRQWLSIYSEFDRDPYPVPRKRQKETKAKSPNLINDKKLLAEATEDHAQKQLKDFIETKLQDYKDQRDIPSILGTSELSHYLTIGLLSPRRCIEAARMFNSGELSGGGEGADTWISELVWREFYIHLLAANPSISKNKPLKMETEKVPWRYDKDDFKKWCEGKTGFPLVDAAMVQLNTTGWMHNRLRMVVATFLTKYLLIDWRWGETYFMKNLTDGQFASNNGGWQWSASTGTDAAPYFRILSPVRQGDRFDPDGKFIKQFLPQLKDVPSKFLHKPGCDALLEAGYPSPMIDLQWAKDRCLSAFKSI